MRLDAIIQPKGEATRAVTIPVGSKNAPTLRHIAQRTAQVQNGLRKLNASDVHVLEPFKGRIELSTINSTLTFGFDFTQVDIDCRAHRGPLLTLTDIHRERHLQVQLSNEHIQALDSDTPSFYVCKHCNSELNDKEAMKGDEICSPCEVDRT